MKQFPLTKCNQCDTFYIDTNPKNNAPTFEVSDLMISTETMRDDEGGFIGCPCCKTDAYLMDVTEYEMPSIEQILQRKIEGTDCTEDESAEIKGWLRDTVILPDSTDQRINEMIQIHFPLEYGEYLDTIL